MVSMDKGLDLKETSFRGADLKLFVRDVRDRQGRKRPITVRSWSTIKDVKDTIQQAIHVPAGSQRLFFGPLLTSGRELPNHRTLHDAGIYRSGETLLLDIKGGSSALASVLSGYSVQSESKSDICVSSSVIDSTPRQLRQLVQRSRRALNLGLKPEFILEGSGGTYFLHDTRKAKIAVFKPADEEPYAEHNPRGYLQQPGQTMFLREGVVPGEACIREVAAYMLDHGGFSGVPMTSLVEARHPSFNSNGSRLKVSEGGASIGAHSLSKNSRATPALAKKVGSFQEFVRSECSMDDLSPSKISADEVHKIAILDIRLMNADRNSANLLCRRRRDNSIELVPIDHGFCLRSVADVSWMDWCWLDWPQLKQPLSKKTKEYVRNLDIEKDARILKEKLNICTEAIDYFCASSRILKAGVEAGLSLYDIAVMCCRNDNMGEIPSKLEKLFSMAADLAGSAIENGRWHHAAASRALVEQLTPKGGGFLSAPPSKAVHKSVSAFNLAQFSRLSQSGQARSQQEQAPGVIPSSASDSSSDTADDDQEECEEWAAALIADVSIDKGLLDSKPRSASIDSEHSSDSGSSASNQGFWLTRPGSTSGSSDTEDDVDSISWSPPSSSSNFFDLSAELEVETLQNSYHDLGHRTGAGEPHRGAVSEPGFRKPGPKVTFSNLEPDYGGVDVPLDVKINHSTSPNCENFQTSPTQRPKKTLKMQRSLSYTALPTTAIEKTSVEEETKKFRPIDDEQHRDYFLKFTELVIAREICAASRNVKNE